MTSVEKALAEYEKKFGGVPTFLIRGMRDKDIIRVLGECVKTGKELEAPDDDDY